VIGYIRHMTKGSPVAPTDRIASEPDQPAGPVRLTLVVHELATAEVQNDRLDRSVSSKRRGSPRRVVDRHQIGEQGLTLVRLLDPSPPERLIHKEDEFADCAHGVLLRFRRGGYEASVVRARCTVDGSGPDLRVGQLELRIGSTLGGLSFSAAWSLALTAALVVRIPANEKATVSVILVPALPGGVLALWRRGHAVLVACAFLAGLTGAGEPHRRCGTSVRAVHRHVHLGSRRIRT
jgi:hypothetical protein